MSILWVALFSVMAIALLAYGQYRLRQQLQMELAEQKQQLLATQEELRALSNASIGMGNKLFNQDKRWFDLQNRIEEMAKNDPARVSYSEASRLVELGAGIEDLMNSCGISRPEAELVTALSRKQQERIPVIN